MGNSGDNAVGARIFCWNSAPMSFLLVIIRRNRFSTSDYAYYYTFLRSVVCLSVCHIRAPAYTVRRISMPFGRYSCEVQWHIVLDGVPGKGKFGDRAPSHNMLSPGK